MPSLTSGLKLGSGSVSSLLKSAGTIQTEINTYNDSVAAYTYANSAYTDSALQTYSDYLNGRITNVSSLGGPVNAEKALTLTKTLESAQKSNISATIARENIQVLAGNATLNDKYDTVVQQFSRAQAIGDDTLAQSLMSQAYSISQSIQYQAQQASAAATTLSAAKATSNESVVTNITQGIKQLVAYTKQSSGSSIDKAASAWVKANAPTLATLGVVVKSQPNFFDVINGAAAAEYNAHMLAYTAELPVNPQTAQNYYNDAIDLASGATKIDTGLAGSLTIQEVQRAAADKSMFTYNASTNTYIRNAQSGYEVNPNFGKTNPATGTTDNTFTQPAYSGSIKQTVIAAPQTAVMMNQFHLNFSQNTGGTTGNGVLVQSTAQTPTWLKAILPNNTATNLFYNPNTKQYQFQANATNGGVGQATYTIVTDGTGKKGLVESSTAGDRVLGGEYGFNQNSLNPKSPSGSGTGANLSALSSKLPGSPHLSLSSDFGGVNELITNSQQLQQATAAANAKAALALLPKIAPVLPNINIAPPSVTTPAQNAPIKFVTPNTVNPQAPTVNPQTPTGVSLQGGSTNLQGGGGIKL